MLKSIRHTFLILVLLIPFVISSCSTFDPPVVIPIYGHIDSIHFTIPPDSVNKQGSASSKIPYTWVYLDDNPVGAFQMPCTFPMVAGNGTHNIKIYSGVAAAGGTSPVSINPFYQYYSININMQQGSTYKFQPVSMYYSWVTFPFMENFDESSNVPTHIVNYHGGGNAATASTTSMLITNKRGLVFQGKGSGMTVVNSAHPYYIGITNPGNSLPNSGSPVYMELNYRATTIFTIGMFDADTTNQSNPILVYPAPTWTKMYVTLNSTISTFNIQPQNIYFTIGLDSVDDHTSDTLLLDNIKILD